MPTPEQQPSLQERFAPGNRCFGCGPANPRGLRIRSFPAGPGADAEVQARWQPAEHHQAFENILNGGIIGTLLDCHSNWTACWHLMRRDALEEPPSTVTADFHVRLRRPTPMGEPVDLVARVRESEGPRVVVEATLAAGGEVTATCTGTFVAVGPGHPAYHRWS
ncbi:MAG: PaaI family thioesterase [Thermoanaerobaculia bacterium]|nr:PaaI family thioesterase [Thermoanaerobaculia bacterium]